MTIGHIGRLCSLFCLLAACSVQPVVEEAAHPELFEAERLAASAYDKGEWLESEKHYVVLVESDPEKSLNWLRLGNIYARTNRPEAAVRVYREALLRDNELANAWYNMGIIQLRQAAHTFNEMRIHIDPDSPVAQRGQELLDGLLEMIQSNSN